jgi:streptogramin lyase
MSITRVRRAGLAGAFVIASVVAYQLGTDAAATPQPSVVVPITPCRLADTRPATLVGPHSTPIGATETVTFVVWGINGNCTIPSNATGIVANITSVAGTAPSYLTVFPGDAPRPTASNLNWSVGGTVVANLLTVGLSSSGTIKVYNQAGSTNVIIDITAYLLPTTSPAAGSRNRISTDQIARLRWDLDPGRELTYTTAAGPAMAAFDGTNLWITNTAINQVSRMNPATGQRDDYTTGAQPTFVLYDGTYVWVANSSANTVSRFDPVTGHRDDFPTLVQPTGMAFDGSHLWIAEYGSNKVSRMNPSTGTRDDFNSGIGPVGVAFDGIYIWVADNASASLHRFNTTTGASTGYPTTANPYSLIYDGSSLWTTNSSPTNSITKFNPLTGTKSDYASGSGAFGLAYDGADIWVTNIGAGTVSRMDPHNGTRQDYVVGASPHGVVYDGMNIWVVCSDSNTIVRLLP